jgi:2-amino-4-hydroxy-6-hydroxymethyldihydropteridine diphosphokinase
LVLPHPGIAVRIFVLEPLYEIAPELDVPGLGAVRELRAARRADRIERIGLRNAENH